MISEAHFWELVVANLPNFIGLVVTIWILVKRTKKQDEMIDYVLKRLLNGDPTNEPP